MFGPKRYCIIFSFILLANHLPAQSITGTWEGDLGDDQFIQMNIIQTGNKLCGYTWDYVKNDRRSFCKAYFEGRYYKNQDEWVLNGTSFIENSGFHYLMRIKMTNSFIDGRNILEGTSTIKSLLINLLNPGEADSIRLVKVANRPREVLDEMRDCYLEEKKANDSVPVKRRVRAKPVTTPADPVVTVPVKPADTLAKKEPIAPPLAKTDTVAIIKPVTKRKNTEQNRIEVNVKDITLQVYDNAIVDGDTVSIFYNGKLLLSHQRLSEKPIIINLELDEKQSRHELILFAENLGSIPPNTALIVITAGDKRYELYASSSLEENSVLIFDYKPK